MADDSAIESLSRISGEERLGVQFMDHLQGRDLFLLRGEGVPQFPRDLP